MDGKLYFTVTLVVLAWVSVNTCRADSNGTVTTTNATTASTATMATSNTTASTATVATSNTTASTATVATSNTTASTATMATSNTTASNTTMATSNTTASNTTMATSNTTASTATMATSNTTAAQSLTPNNTVSPLNTNLSNSGCGTQKLCVNEPASCDPGSGACSFFSAKPSGQNFEFALAGESAGYVAAVISSDTTLGGSDTTYVCFNNNGTVAFTGASLNTNQLTKQNVSANNVRGKVNGTKIQCVFDATLPAVSARSTSRTVGIVTGTYNSSAGTFGTTTTVIRTNAVDLSSANATVQNLETLNTTASPNATTNGNTTNNAMFFRQTLFQALFISAGVMGLAVL